MSGKDSTCARERKRLSRSLLVRAVCGLSFLWLLAVVAGMLAWAGLNAAYRELNAGGLFAAVALTGASCIAAAAAAVLVRWLYAPAPVPTGVRLKREEIRTLNELIKRIRRKVGGVPVNAVWVTGDMNAGILQRPAWGLVGPMRTHLMLGLPLMHSISERQFVAILAHEYGHLVRQRQGLAAWAYHLRSWWYRVMDRCLNDCTFLSQLALVERWSAEDLAQASRLSRFEELEADEVAARLVGAELVGETLVEVALKERFLVRDFWNKVMAQSTSRPRPTIRPYRDLGLGVMAGFRRPAEWSEFPMSMFEDDESEIDLHPSLVERLNALGTPPVGGRRDGRSAARRYLMPMLTRLAWTFDRAWWADNRNNWRDCYRCARESSRDDTLG